MARYLTLFLHILLLGILYLFVFRVVVMILKDLRRERTGARETEGVTPGAPVGDRAAVLRVAESDDPRYAAGQQIRLDRVIYIGRGEENQVNLTGSFASHRHARIIFREGRFFLEDLGSTNGTYINGVRITDPVMLKHGDLIRVADVTLQLVRWEHEME